MITSFKQVGGYGIFQFDTDKLPANINAEMQTQGYHAANEVELDNFLIQHSIEIDGIPLIASNSSATRSDGVTGKKCLIDLDGVQKTNYWFTTVLFMDNKYLGVHN